jgi:hypothetical protein
MTELGIPANTAQTYQDRDWQRAKPVDLSGAWPSRPLRKATSRCERASRLLNSNTSTFSFPAALRSSGHAMTRPRRYGSMGYVESKRSSLTMLFATARLL